MKNSFSSIAYPNNKPWSPAPNFLFFDLSTPKAISELCGIMALIILKSFSLYPNGFKISQAILIVSTYPLVVICPPI